MALAIEARAAEGVFPARHDLAETAREAGIGNDAAVIGERAFDEIVEPGERRTPGR